MPTNVLRNLMPSPQTWALRRPLSETPKERDRFVGSLGKASALLRWTVTCHMTANYDAAIHEFCAGESLDEKIHEGCHTAAMKRDEDHVQTLRSHIKNSMTNTFDITSHPEVLINISTGLHASSQLQAMLPGISEKGQHMMKQFLEQCLSEVGEKSFHSTKTKSGIITVGDIQGKNKPLGIGKVV